MPRPCRCRRVCEEPRFRTFLPENRSNLPPVTLFIDEYEVIRIVDLEKRSHEECAQQMCISRTTVTEIYEKARTKIADAVVNGRGLVIDGGNYQVCHGSFRQNCIGHCRREHQPHCFSISTKSHGDQKMKIAVPVKNEQIYQHFGMAAQFKVYTVQNDQIVETEFIQAQGRGHGMMLVLLTENGIGCVICGGIGNGAVSALDQAGIELVAGVSGLADEAVAQLLSGELQGDLRAACEKSQHGHHHADGCGCGCGGDHDDCQCKR